MSIFKLNKTKEDEQVGIIYQTNNYNKFSFAEMNREIDYKHVERLKKEMQERFIRTNIIVDDQYVILEGQHRYEAIKDLGLPLTYTIINPEDSESFIISMNTNTKNWKNDEYLNFYVKKEKTKNPLNCHDMPYHNFKRARDYKIHFMTLIELIYSSRQKEHTIGFGKGKLFIQDKALFKENVNFLVTAMKQHKACEHRNTQLALCKYLIDKNFDKETFLEKLKKFPDKLVRSSTMDQATLNIKTLYNYFNKKSKLI